MRWTLSVAMVPPEDLPEIARVAEETGWDAISVPDSVFYPETVSAAYPYSVDGSRMWSPDTAMPDPLMTVAALAATTSRIRFRTSVLKVPLRDPLLLAKQVATLAALSGDRFELGVGVSWMPEEFRFTGTEMSTRGARLDEAVSIIRAVCAGGGPQWVEHHGKHHDFDRLMISPAPARPLPVLVGGHSDPALRRAATVGDGWISAGLTAAEVAPYVEKLGVLRVEAGRADLPFSVCIAPTGASDPAGLAAFETAGATDLWLAPWRFYGHGLADRATRLDSVRRFADEVMQ